MTRARLFLTLIMVCMVLGPFAAAPSSAHIVGELAAAPEPAPSAAMAPSSAPVITVATFTSPQLPTGLTIDSRGDIYVSMAISGEIRRLARSGGQSVIATFQTGFSPTQFGFLGGTRNGLPGRRLRRPPVVQRARHGYPRNLAREPGGHEAADRSPSQ
jgi:hypothetical protein